jgi:hypothetical protein
VRRAAACAGLLTLAALSGGCGSTTAAPAGGSSIVPASVPAYIAIDSDPGSPQWQTVDDLASRFPDKQKGVDEIRSSLRNDAGLDFEKDVKPALGPEIDVVWLDFAAGGADVVALMQPADQGAFERLVAKGNAKDPSSKLLYESVDGWEVMSDRQSTIDKFKALVTPNGPVLADDPAFSQAMSEYSDDALVKAYVSGRAVMNEVRANLPPDATKLVDKIGSLDWVAASVRASSDGVRVDTTVRGEPGSLLRSQSKATKGSSFEPSLANDIPGDALAYLAFHGADGAVSGVKGNPALASPAFRPVKDLLGKVGRLVAGEGALYVRPAPGRVPEVTLVTEPSAGTDGAALLDRILSGASLHLPIHRTQVAGVESRTIRFGGGFGLHYANVGRNLVVSDLAAGIAGFADGGPGLAKSGTYSDALSAAGTPKQVQELFYVDVRGGVDLAQRLSNAPIPASVKRNLGPLKSAVEYAAGRPSEIQVTLFVGIGQ